MSDLDRVLVALAFSALLLPQSSLSKQYTERQKVEITDAQREQLLAATIKTMVEPPSEDLLRAIGVGKIDQFRVTQFESKPTAGEVGFPTDEWTTHHFGSVFYERVPLSDSREYQPKVTCSSQGNDVWFQACYEDSYIRLQAEWMDKPIRFDGDLTDQEVKSLYSAVDNVALVSRTDGEIVTSDKIYMVLKYKHAGNRVNVYVTTAKDDYTDVIYFKNVPNDDGQTRFAVSDFRCGTD